jgi:hypothetical protein
MAVENKIFWRNNAEHLNWPKVFRGAFENVGMALGLGLNYGNGGPF